MIVMNQTEVSRQVILFIVKNLRSDGIPLGIVVGMRDGLLEGISDGT